MYEDDDFIGDFFLFGDGGGHYVPDPIRVIVFLLIREILSPRTRLPR